MTDDLETRVAALETIVFSLRARQNDHRGELARVADDVADVRVVQGEHTEALALINAELAAHTGAFESITGTLNDHGRLLADHHGMLIKQGETLIEHGTMLRQILDRLPPADG